MNRDLDGVNDGQVIFGGIDLVKYVGEIKYVDVMMEYKVKGEWVIFIEGFVFDGKQVKFNFIKVIIDIGIIYIFGLLFDVVEFFKFVFGVKLDEKLVYIEYIVFCDIKMVFKVIFGGVVYEILVKDWVV